MTLVSGAHLGPYQILSTLGAGGMGEVFRARDTRLGRDVALKVLPSLFASDPDRLRRFEQEARAAAALNHPNILVVHDVSASGDVPYVVSELLEGRTLRQVIEGGPLPARKAGDYGAQIARGLAAAHDKGIVHRDLKPENVFVTKDGRVKILDFGLAKLAGPASADGSRETMAQTDPGMVVGTVGYMSPEQLRGETVDARSDVFSLGAVLYEMFCGERAFKGKTAVDTMSAILKEDPADFPPQIHATAPAIERIVRRCLEKDFDERFKSARDVTFALEALSSTGGSSPAVVAPTAPSKRRPTAARVMGVAAAGAIIVAAGGYAGGAKFGASPNVPPSITQLTFRNGTVRGARFSPDGQTVLYAAAWGGEPIKLYSTRPGNPESSPLNLPSADLVAIAPKTGELGLTLNPVSEATFWTKGTLARAPLSGGAPREMLEHVIAADFTPDGSSLGAAIVDTPAGHRLEFPIGSLRLMTPYDLSDVKISPDGLQAAFLTHPGGGDDGMVMVVGKSGEPRALTRRFLSVQGLAWARGGTELWFTAAEAGGLRAIRAVTLDGKERTLYHGPSRLQLEDVAPDGRVLVTGISLQAQVRFGSIAGKTDRELSWFDYGTSPSLSADGSLLAFTESGEGAGSKYGVFVRPTNGDPAVRLADGAASVLSPDGKQIAITGENDRIIRIVPTGAGATKTFDLTKFESLTASAWFPDGTRLAVVVAEKDKKFCTVQLDIASGALTVLTAEGTRGRLVSPDGRWLAVSTGAAKQLLDLHSKVLTPLAGLEKDGIVGWSPDAKALFTAQPAGHAVRLFRVDVTSGARSELATVQPPDASGLVELSELSLAGDGDHFVYTMTRQLSHLFLLKLSQ
jgi:serine/threonine protein kinase/Tol biopolymer transport system component